MRRQKPYLVYVLRIHFIYTFYIYILFIYNLPSPFPFYHWLSAAVYPPLIYLFTALYMYTFSAPIYVYVFRTYKHLTAAHPFYVYVYCTDRCYICIRLLLKVYVEVVARFSTAALCALRES